MKKYRPFKGSMIAALFATASLLPFAESASAQQQPEPAAVIAISSVDSQLNDIQYLAGATSEMMGQMSGLIRLQAQGFLPGVDFGKPAGAMLYFREGQQQPDSLAFFPVKNIEDILDKISEFAELEEEGDTVTIIPDNGDELTLIHKGDYAFVSQRPEMLENLPSDPASLISEQTAAYNISGKIFPQRVPEDLREQAMDWMRESFEDNLQNMDDLQAELQEANFKMQIEQMELMLDETEQVLVGLNIDKESERVLFDLTMKAESGSELETKLNAANKAEDSWFSGFLMDGVAASFHNCSGIGKEDAENQVAVLSRSRDALLEDQAEKVSESDLQLLREITDALLDSTKKTMMAGTIDMGGAVFTEDGLNGVVGAKILDAKSLEDTIRQVVSRKTASMEDDRVEIQLDSGSHNGINLHQVTVALDPEEVDDKALKMLGEKVTIILGIGQDRVYAGAGKSPLAHLQKAIDANANSSSSKPDVLGQFNMFFAPIMNLVAQVETDQPMVESLRAKIAEVGKDRMRMIYDVEGGEMKMQVEVQDGIFSLFGVAAEAMQGGMGGGADF